MSFASPEFNDTQNPHNESFNNRSTSSSPANSENLETNLNGLENTDHPQDTVNQTKIYKCKQCVFICVNKEDYWLHQRQMHIKPEKLLECSKCQFVTEYKHHLEYHLRNHIGSKPYKCSQCEYACVNLSMLRSHLKSHSKAIQYNCAECSYSTKYYNSLKAHMEKFNHTGTASTNPSTLINGVGNGKIKNQVTSQNKTSSSSSSSTCSSSSFNSSSFDLLNQKRQRKQNKQASKQQQQHQQSQQHVLLTKDGSVNSSNSSVSSASSSLSSSPNWSGQLNINPSTNLKQPSEISPQMKFNPTSALAAAALAYQQQQQQQQHQQQQQTVPNFLLNPSLLFNTPNLGNLMMQNTQQDMPDPSVNSLNESQQPLLEKNSDSNEDNDNQLNLIQQQIQLQMALAMAASSNNSQFQTNTNNNNQKNTNQQFSNILSDFYIQQQQKTQQDQLLLAASYLQNHQQLTQGSSTNNNKRTLDIESSDPDFTHQEPDSKKAHLNNPVKCSSCPMKFETKKDLKKHNRTTHQVSPESAAAAKPVPIESSNSQLHECFKCELIFRNYDMYLAHKMLHDMQDVQKQDDTNSNNTSMNEVKPQQQQQPQSNMDLNNLLTQKLLADSFLQSQSKSEKLESSSQFDCTQCNLKMSNALQYFIHVQTFHATQNSQIEGALGSITSIQNKSIDQLEQET